MQTKRSLINESRICVLRLDGDGDRTYVSIEKFYNSYSSEIRNLYDCYDNPNVSCKEMFESIWAKRRFRRDLLGDDFDFCEKLREPYQKLPSFDDDAVKRYTEYAPSLDRGLKKELMSRCETRITALLLECTYNDLRSDKTALMYSHRCLGWRKEEYGLTPDLTVTIDTNFGYGASSYFFLYMRYKEIDIIPFSKWVSYRYAGYADIVRYTEEYPLENESWYDAFSLVSDAINTAQSDTVGFIGKYLIGECEDMISGLEKILEGHCFELYDNIKKNKSTLETISFEGHELIEFRGEKISGALKFIENILKLAPVGEVRTYVERIEKCNRIIQPILVNEISLIGNEIEGMRDHYESVKKIYEAIHNKYLEYQRLKEELQKNLIEEYGAAYKNLYLSKDELEKLLPGGRLFADVYQEKYPEYPDFLNEFNRVSSQYRELERIYRPLQHTLKNIERYNDVISEYFSKQDPI